MKLFVVAALVAGMAGMAASASAQDFNANPTYGTIRLNAGFTPDPYNRSLQAGGSINAGQVFERCAGFIANAPDFRFHWSGGGSLPLIVSVNANSDTTLVINGPGGEWYCDDDSGEGLNPSIQLPARSGRYEIWVGTYRSGSLAPATLSISELYSN
jgi:hypothetical protein